MARSIDGLQQELTQTQSEEEVAVSKERIAARQREYWDIENMPTWPVDLTTWRRFARNNMVLALPLIAKLLALTPLPAGCSQP